MRAVRVEQLAPDYAGCALREIETPRPGPGEVLVRVRAAAINFPDLLQTRGEYQHKPELPFTLGQEAAGEVVEVGEDAPVQVGAAVVGRGGYAEYAVMRDPRPIPAGVSFAEAAAFGVAYLTAYVALVRRGSAQPGEWLLVHGAAGGVGLAAADLGRALGLKVIAAAASAEKLAVVEREYAPDAIVDVSKGFKDQVKQITGGHGADLIYDPVGGDVFDESVRCIAPNGRLLVIGFASGRIPTLPVNLALIKTFSVIGVRAGEFGRQFPALGRQNQDAIWAMLALGKLHPRVHAELPLEQWRAGMDLLADRKVVGKVVLRP
ncbi:MAG TPA: NADPH:quinone oxidoreductase family protein [Caulobacteraceae bacterium]|nr:NADPH:quinone oxidoreductase family protein [Caulobacteraceae bacterium]